jgi:Arc/MetJ-type ribon-helix-helix transcriptional regulator
MSENRMVSFMAPASLVDEVEALVKRGRYTHMSDAWRGIARLGVEKENEKEKM